MLRIWAPGSDRPGPRIRIDSVGVATIFAALVLMAACVDVSGPRIHIVNAEPSSSSLVLGLDTCNADLSADVEETAEEVRIRVYAENDTPDDCADGIQLTLDDALGNRRVINDRTGEQLDVVPPD